jgi:tetratricopeptide (TPR) repeat protein
MILKGGITMNISAKHILGARLGAWIVGLALCFLALRTRGAEANSEEREREIRDRYEKVLLRNPFQERAFAQVYESYLKYEGVDAWAKKLQPQTEAAEPLGALLLLGQLYDRQFKSKEAIAVFEKASSLGEKRAPFKVLLGNLYYKSGDDEKAAQLLTSALDDLADLDQRSSVCRTLGNIYLRQVNL